MHDWQPSKAGDLMLHMIIKMHQETLNPMYSPSPLEQYDSLSLSLSLSPIVCGNEWILDKILARDFDCERLLCEWSEWALIRVRVIAALLVVVMMMMMLLPSDGLLWRFFSSVIIISKMVSLQSHACVFWWVSWLIMVWGRFCTDKNVWRKIVLGFCN